MTKDESGGAEKYALGLLAEEMGEALQLIGKALRFGIDTPGVKDPLTGEVLDVTPRALLEKELGDVWAAIEYAAVRGIISGGEVILAQKAKLSKLLDPSARDNLGRRLAP